MPNWMRVGGFAAHLITKGGRMIALADGDDAIDELLDEGEG